MAVADDDPEFDFGERGKFKRSKVVEDFNRMRSSQQAEAKRAAEAEKRATAAESLREHLKTLGIDHEAFSKDPRAAFKAAAHDYVRRQIEEAQLDPAELELRRREETITEREQRIASEEDTRKQEAHTALVQQRQDHFATQMKTALESSSLPRSPEMIARMATLMIAAERSGKRFPLAELAQRAAQSMYAEQSAHASSLAEDPKATAQFLKPYFSHFKGDGAALADALGAENVDALRKHILNEHESKFLPKKPAPNQQPRKPKVFENPKHPNGYITFDEMVAKSKARGI